jgi:beta-glucosidase
VVEVYLSQPKGFETPIRELASFKRIHLNPNESTHVSLTINPRSLGQVDAKGNRVIVPGEYTVSVGSTQPGESQGVQTGKFVIKGQATLPK